MLLAIELAFLCQHFKLNIFMGFESELQTNPMKPNAVSFTVAVGRHANTPLCDGLGRNTIVRVGKYSGPVLSRLWTKVFLSSRRFETM